MHAQACRAKRVSLRFEPAAGVYNILPAIGVVSVADQVERPTIWTEPKRVVSDKL